MEQDRLDSLECEIKELRHLLTIVCANVGLCPKTGKKENGLFTSQKEHGRRLGEIREDLQRSISQIREELRHNVTWPGFFRGVMLFSGFLSAIGAIFVFLLRSVK